MTRYMSILCNLFFDASLLLGLLFELYSTEYTDRLPVPGEATQGNTLTPIANRSHDRPTSDMGLHAERFPTGILSRFDYRPSISKREMS